ncbi:hypothetical protein [Mesorhizobium sp. BH1-1-4]|uniref:hypothetical protein n=1 Tax=Mesorhizobium sp. BH1-1-4 TaxID=2876662 RepID=UPI001CD18B74|nr:hypothetical protein [Mesorhizobium sp. BH1-1-4]MBZ9998079.1 hypothetical protein [Mesorhizobium sp. BH1-1-4]
MQTIATGGVALSDCLWEGLTCRPEEKLGWSPPLRELSLAGKPIVARCRALGRWHNNSRRQA